MAISGHSYVGPDGHREAMYWDPDGVEPKAVRASWWERLKGWLCRDRWHRISRVYIGHSWTAPPAKCEIQPSRLAELNDMDDSAFNEYYQREFYQRQYPMHDQAEREFQRALDERWRRRGMIYFN
jgi:hypothetical protein